MSTPSQRTFFKALGPGLLFAGAAVGVSHLVQSTRAGALFGLALVFVVLLANVFKYPAFQFGPRYAAATGTSLLEGYRRQGQWALILYAVLTLATMFTVQAAVTFLTVGLVQAIAGTLGYEIELSQLVIAALLMGACALLVAVGRYAVLDKIIKVVVAVLTIATLAATALVLPEVDWSGPWLPDLGAWNDKAVLLVAGLIGWMPSAIDISVWHSLWTLARKDETGHAPTPKEARLDFNIGYFGTALLAFCFVIMGAGVMHGSPEPIEASAGKFAAQVVQLYAETLGDWSLPIIAVCTFGVMFSTTLTVIDGFARAISRLIARFGGPETPDAVETSTERRTYWLALAVLYTGSLVLIGFFLKSLLALVTVATIASFLTAPALAWLNHRAMFGEEVPPAHRPGRGMRRFSLAGIAFNGLVAAGYLIALVLL